jgi:hypothetical protein
MPSQQAGLCASKAWSARQLLQCIEDGAMAIPVWMPVTAIYDYNDDDDDCDDDDDEDGDDGADKDNDKHRFSLKVPVG